MFDRKQLLYWKARLKGLAMRMEHRHLLELLKYIELRLLGKRASTYCLHHPSHVLVELTTKCNLRCRWCNQSKPEWRRKYGNLELPFEAIEKIIPKLQGAKVILLYNIGEPLLYNRLFDAIHLARKHIPHVRITTNAMLLDRDRSRELKRAGLTRLHVSVDSPVPRVQETIRRGSNLSTIEKNIAEFASTGIPVHIWTVISDANADTLAKLPDWAARLEGVKALYFQLQNGVSAGFEMGLPPLGSKKLFEELKREIAVRAQELELDTNIATLPYYPEGFHQRKARGICFAPFVQLVAINVHGQLTPCCSFATMGLGDVISTPFEEVWNGVKMRNWRRAMLEQQYCSYCSEWCGYRQHNPST